MNPEETFPLPSPDGGADDDRMYEFNDIGLALRLNALREPDVG